MSDRPQVVIDDAGISAPSYADYYAWLKEQYYSIFGSDIYVEADSQDGQLIGIFSLVAADAAATAVAVYNSFSPSTAQGNGLARVVKINGLTILAAEKSTVDLTLTGTAGSIITSGIAKDTSENKWLLPDSVTIPAGGTITVTATAKESGPITAAIGTVTKIATPTAGWSAVTNASAAVSGRDIETDAALRKRQALSVSIPSLTVLEGIVGAVAQIEGVTRTKAYENDTDATDVHSIPPHSISIVVEGGDSTTIANTIAQKKTPGAGTFGNVSTLIVDDYGIPHTIKFGRPSQITIDVEIDITALTGYTSVVGTEIKEAVAAAINDLAIGGTVYYTRLYAPALLTGAYANPTSTDHLSTYELTAIRITIEGGTPTAADIVPAYNEVAVTTTSNITINVT